MEILDLITGALRDVGVIDATETPSAEQGAQALKNLNLIMASLAEDGVDFGYVPTTTISDDILLPLGHVLTVQSMLALKEASDRGIDPPPLVVSLASSGRNRMVGQFVSMQITRSQSATLPYGSTQPSGYSIERLG